MGKGRISKEVGVADIHEIFDLGDLCLMKNCWLWWFWLFFFENPMDPARPRQFAVLWSAKNDANLECNGVAMGTKDPFREDGSLDGGVAAWYFDGHRMNDNYLLDRTKLHLSRSGITTSSPDTEFRLDNGVFHVVVGDRMNFEATLLGSTDTFTAPWQKQHKYFGQGYEMIGINKLTLKATVDGGMSEGGGYFQKVVLGTVAMPWYWGIFHFRSDACLSYFNPHLLGRSLKKDVAFYDGKVLHRFNEIKVRRANGSLPVYNVSAENEEEAIEFLVESYAGTVWSFRKRIGFIPVKFDYRQYPARITKLSFRSKQDNTTLSEKDMGIGIGNAEDSTGILI